MLSIPVLLLACNQDWTYNHEMIVSLEVSGTNAYNHYAMCPAIIKSSPMYYFNIIICDAFLK